MGICVTTGYNPYISGQPSQPTCMVNFHWTKLWTLQAGAPVLLPPNLYILCGIRRLNKIVVGVGGGKEKISSNSIRRITTPFCKPTGRSRLPPTQTQQPSPHTHFQKRLGSRSAAYHSPDSNHFLRRRSQDLGHPIFSLLSKSSWERRSEQGNRGEVAISSPLATRHD